MSKIPSIAMIPSGYKASKLYSVLPTDGAGDFTTTRASIATRVNENGLLEEVAANVPRLDYSDGTCPSLLLEPTATNLITYSELFSDAYWSKADTTVSNSVISPEGTANAFNLLNNNALGQAYISTSITVTATKNYIFSVFVKKGNVRYIALVNLNPFTSSYFDLQDGVALASNAISSSIEDYGNGWFRCSVETVADTNTKYCGIYLSENGSSLDASGIPNGDGVKIYGAQLEENSYATSYIKNAGTALGVTRTADTANGSGSSTVINSTEGVLYAEISALADDLSLRQISINDGTTNNRVLILYSNVSNTLRADVRVSGSSQALMSTSSQIITNTIKVAIKFKLNDFALWVNGVKVDTDNAGNVFTANTLTSLSFNNGSLSGEVFTGKVKDLRVYTTALSDAELTTLTTI